MNDESAQHGNAMAADRRHDAMTEPARPADDAVPTLWPTELDADYTLVGEQGRGGMAVVFRAVDKSLGREVAVKVVRPRFAADEEAVARLAREARTVAQLEHPNIVGVYSIRHLGDGSVALVMQLIPGRTLKQAVTEDGPFDPERAEQVLRDVARALAYAHRAGVVHRDVKPENIFLDDVSGRAMLSDFGVARVMDAPTELTATGTTIGTPTYMAPEQIDGVQLDGRSDLYSLGMVGWEMLTGERPWAGESLYSVIYRQKHDPLPTIDAYRDDIPSRLQYLIEGLMPKNPDRRWASAARFLTLLASDQPLPGFREWESAQRRRRRSRVFRAARQRGDSVIGAALETVKFSRPPTPVAGLAAGTAKATNAATDVQEPIAGEQPGSPPPDESTMKLRTPARATPKAVGTIRPTPGRRTPGAPLHSGGFSIKRTPGSPGTYSSARGPVTMPEPKGSRVGRALFALGLMAAASGYWWFNYGPGVEEPVRLIGFNQVPQDDPGIELPVLPVHDSARLGVDSTGGATPVAAPAPESMLGPGRGGLTPNADSARLNALPARDRTLTPRLDTASVPARSAPATPESLTVAVPAPVPPPPAAPTLAFPVDRGNITAGNGHSCVLNNQGHAACWGSNQDGQLGDGTYERRLVPNPIAGDFVFSQVTAGAEHTCGLEIDNEVRCWGGNADGQLGDGTTTARTAPVRLNSTVSFQLIRAGRAHTCGLSNSGAVFCWGSNEFGQLGDGTRQLRTSPQMVELPAAAAALSVGWYHTCAVTTDGTGYCWGRNEYGQLGDGTQTARLVPTRVDANAALVSIAAGSTHSCAVSSANRALCWGRSNYGQTGTGSLAATLPRPRDVSGNVPLSTVVAGSAHTCARAIDGTAWCWGRNVYGQLGDGSTDDKSTPVQVRGLSRLASLNAGAAHTCATGRGGEAWCWGYNVEGQVGRGDRESASNPVRLTPPR